MKRLQKVHLTEIGSTKNSVEEFHICLEFDHGDDVTFYFYKGQSIRNILKTLKSVTNSNFEDSLAEN